MSNRFKARIGAGGIPTPLGSDMSRAKFDFSGYDPERMRKRKPPSPERKVIVKVDEDMEIYTSDAANNKDLATENKQRSAALQAALASAIPANEKAQVIEEAIQASSAYRFFTDQEHGAIQQEQHLLDLQVGGMSAESYLELNN